MELKEIKTKINTVKKISQITNALEIVSAVKMKKAQNMALSSRPFAQKVVEILEGLSEYQKTHPEKKLSCFQTENKAEKVLIAVVCSDKGFCGAFNKNILKFAKKEIDEIQKNTGINTNNIDIMAIGKKAIAFFQKNKIEPKIKFTGIGDYGEFEEVKPIAQLFLKYFQENRYQKIYLFYTEFISCFTQKPRKNQILPLDLSVLQKMLKQPELFDRSKKHYKDYIFEPNKEEIFENLVPQLIEFEIYQNILEANASEHSARMIAMKNASQNAKDIMKELKLGYNKTRQDKITSQICEISSTTEALK